MAKVLLVDDHADVLEVVGQLLEMYGHEVVSAGSAEAALEELARAHPEVVITDQTLPGMSGTELIRRLHEGPDTAEIRTILCTGNEGLRASALAAGASGFWLKGSNQMFDAVAHLDERGGVGR